MNWAILAEEESWETTLKVTPFQLAVEERETGFSLSLFYLSSLIEEGRIKNIGWSLLWIPPHPVVVVVVVVLNWKVNKLFQDIVARAWNSQTE